LKSKVESQKSEMKAAALKRRPPEEFFALDTPPDAAIPAGLTGNWWVAHTKPRTEKVLAQELHALGVFQYLPLCRRTTRSRNTGRVSHSLSPVFTGYVFFNADEAGRRAALKTNRIVALLPVTDQALLVRELRQVQQVLASNAEFDWQGRIEAGDWARVLHGPLAGLEGIVLQRKSRWRLVLNVHLLGQSVTVEMPRELLERIDPPGRL
jgi:transcription antitermination factor NusG